MPIKPKKPAKLSVRRGLSRRGVCRLGAVTFAAGMTCGAPLRAATISVLSQSNHVQGSISQSFGPPDPQSYNTTGAAPISGNVNEGIVWATSSASAFSVSDTAFEIIDLAAAEADDTTVFSASSSSITLQFMGSGDPYQTISYSLTDLTTGTLLDSNSWSWSGPGPFPLNFTNTYTIEPGDIEQLILTAQTSEGIDSDTGSGSTLTPSGLSVSFAPDTVIGYVPMPKAAWQGIVGFLALAMGAGLQSRRKRKELRRQAE